MAALVLGRQTMDKELAIKGAIMNQIAGDRHARLVRSSVEQTGKIPVLGEIPELRDLPFKERHLGLVLPQEIQEAEAYLSSCTEIAEKYLDSEQIWQVAVAAPPIEAPDPMPAMGEKKASPSVRVGVIKDSAFQFYYPENLEELENRGGEIIEIHAMGDSAPPAHICLYAHIHALGEQRWADAMIREAELHQ